jgi:hypothetical protein
MTTTNQQARAAMYLRISSDRTGEQLGVTRQRQDCEPCARRRLFGVPVVVAVAQAAGVSHTVAKEAVALDTDTTGTGVQWSENAGCRRRRFDCVGDDMKVTVTKGIRVAHDNKVYQNGQTADVPEPLIHRGWASESKTAGTLPDPRGLRKLGGK